MSNQNIKPTSFSLNLTGLTKVSLVDLVVPISKRYHVFQTDVLAKICSNLIQNPESVFLIENTDITKKVIYG